MAAMRRGDTEPHPRFRESRFFHSMEHWYFLTREGFIEGPFDNRRRAEEVLQAYLGELASA